MQIFWGARALGSIVGNPNAIGLSRKHIIEGLDAALERLQVCIICTAYIVLCNHIYVCKYSVRHRLYLEVIYYS